jgi:hypothetical protein
MAYTTDRDKDQQATTSSSSSISLLSTGKVDLDLMMQGKKRREIIRGTNAISSSA